MATCYRAWARSFGADHTTQGQLFEELAKESISTTFNGWKVELTGWSRANTSKLTAVVSNTARLLDESIGNLEKWTSSSANEAGLDLICWRPFADGRGCYPTLLFQCASGGDWEDKVETPDLKIWRRLVEFRAQGLPRKAFATPFAFLDEEFTRTCNKVDGLLMDRYRLLAAGAVKTNWVPRELARQLATWAKPRQARLPKLS